MAQSQQSDRSKPDDSCDIIILVEALSDHLCTQRQYSPTPTFSMWDAGLMMQGYETHPTLCNKIQIQIDEEGMFVISDRSRVRHGHTSR